MVDEFLNFGFEIAGQEVVPQKHAVLPSLMPPLDLALNLGMIRRTSGVLHAFGLQPFGQLFRDVAGSAGVGAITAYVKLGSLWENGYCE